MAEKESVSKQSAPATRARKRKKVDSSMAAPWTDFKVGDCIEGTYLGREKVRGKGARRDFWSYHIETATARLRVSSAMLNSKMNQVPVGTYVWITYLGEFETSNGTSKNFEVETEEGVDLLDPLKDPAAAEGEISR